MSIRYVLLIIVLMLCAPAYALSPAGYVRHVYSSTSVTTGAWVELVSATERPVNEIEIFDSSGQVLELGFGAEDEEVSKFRILPGGNGRFKLSIERGTRIAIRAVSATASVGEININFFY